MKTFTAHVKPGREPVLVPEAFSIGALLFGPLWFAAHRAWVGAAFHLLLVVIAAAVLPPAVAAVVIGAAAVLAGLVGRDVLRWSLERRGYICSDVLAARDHEGALARLLTYRPDIAASLAARLA